MKKLVLSLLAVFATALLSYAQAPLCQPCQPIVSPTHHYIHVICSTGELDPGCDSNRAGEDVPVVFVYVNYRLVFCPPRVQMIVDGVVLLDERDAFSNSPGCNLTASCDGVVPSFPLTDAYIRMKQQEAIQAAVTALNLTTDVEVIFEGSCNSLVRVAFPERTFLLQNRGDAPGQDTVWIEAGADIWQTLPCNDACCKVL